MCWRSASVSTTARGLPSLADNSLAQPSHATPSRGPSMMPARTVVKTLIYNTPMLTLATFEALLGPRGQEALAEAAALELLPASRLADIEVLRSRYGAELA